MEMSNIEYILNCFLKSEEGFAEEIKDNIDDYDNIFSEYVIPFLIPKEVNIVLIGLANTGKTSFIKSLGGELKEDNIDYSLYEIYIHDMLINMYEFSSKNMYKNMTKKYDNIENIKSSNPFKDYNFDGNKLIIILNNKGFPYNKENDRGNLIIYLTLIKDNKFIELCNN